MLDVTFFNQVADQKLEDLMDRLEVLLEDGEVDVLHETLTVQLPSGQQYIINKHGPSQQIWVASPFSGAHHFRYDEVQKRWQNVRNETILDDFLEDELKSHVA